MGGDPQFLADRLAAWDLRQSGWDGAPYRGRDRPSVGDIVLMSNDYLALAGHRHVVDARLNSLRRQGNGLMMSSAFVGEDGLRRSVEKRFADLVGKPAAVLCQSGWTANVGLIQAITPAGTPVYVDTTAHASLLAGVHAAEAEPKLFVHNDLDHLERQIGKFGPGLIAVDTIYSVTGDECPLAELVELADRAGCCLVADESHALGVRGPGGAGLVAELGLTERVPLITASLAKTFAGRAGLIACSERIADFLPFHSFGAIFSTTLLNHDLAGLSAALDVVAVADDRRARLARNAQVLRDGLTELGYNIAPSISQIIPLQPGSESQICLLQRLLDDRGVFGAAFTPPATPPNRCVHRLSVHSELTDADLARVLDVCAAVRDEAGVADWKSTRHLVAAR